MKKDFTSNLKADTQENATKKLLNEDSKPKGKLKGYCLQLEEETFYKLKELSLKNREKIKDILTRAIENELKRYK